MIVLLVSFMFFIFIPSPTPAEQIPTQSEQLVEGVVAVITSKGRNPIREIIFYSDLERHRLFFAPSAEKSDPAQRLNQVIEQRLLRPEARRFILEKPKLEAVKTRLVQIQNRFENNLAFENALRQTGLSEMELETEIRENLWVEQLLDERIKGFIFISPKVIEEYFQNHPDLFSGQTLAESIEGIETFLIAEKESQKKTEYLKRIKAKAKINILLK